MDELAVRRDGAALWLTIDREARRNALSPAVLSGMLAALREPGDARVVVVASVGERVFCSGADLAVMDDDATGLDRHVERGLLRDVVLAMRACPLPVLVRVQGLCLAGGLALVLGADVAIAAERAAFGLPEADVGLWPFMVGALLARHVSPKHAVDLMLGGERVDARTAWAMGMLSRVVPDGELDAAVTAYVDRVAGLPPVALRLGKAGWAAATETPLAPALEAMQAQLSLLTTTHDAREGLAAFREKRAPRWQGR